WRRRLALPLRLFLQRPWLPRQPLFALRQVWLELRRQPGLPPPWRPRLVRLQLWRRPTLARRPPLLPPRLLLVRRFPSPPFQRRPFLPLLSARRLFSRPALAHWRSARPQPT